ncbi:hypothetical protein D3C81_908730 [compost metagenome]
MAQKNAELEQKAINMSNNIAFAVKRLREAYAVWGELERQGFPLPENVLDEEAHEIGSAEDAFSLLESWGSSAFNQIGDDTDDV